MVAFSFFLLWTKQLCLPEYNPLSISEGPAAATTSYKLPLKGFRVCWLTGETGYGLVSGLEHCVLLSPCYNLGELDVHQGTSNSVLPGLSVGAVGPADLWLLCPVVVCFCFFFLSP